MATREGLRTGVMTAAGATAGAVVALAGVGVLLAALTGSLQDVCLGLMFGPLLVAGGGWTLVGAVSWGRGKAALGPVRLLTATDRFVPGDALDVRVVFTPRRAVTLDRAEVGVECTDELGDSSTLVARTTATLIGAPIDLGPGEQVVLGARLRVPTDGVPTRLPGEEDVGRYAWTVRCTLEAGALRSAEASRGITVREEPDGAVRTPLPAPTVAPPSAGDTRRLRPAVAFPAPDLRVVGTIEVEVQPNQRCPFCRDALQGVAADALMTCAGCQAVFHRACALEVGSCTTAGCRNNRRTRTRA